MASEKESFTGADDDDTGPHVASIAVTTDEEKESVLLDLEAKLYRLDKEGMNWEKKRVGTVKLLKHNESGKVRFVMWRSKTRKICANHFVLPSINLKEHVGNKKSCVWQADDYAHGESKNVNFCLHFASVEDCKYFKEMVKEVDKSPAPPTAAKERLSIGNDDQVKKIEPKEDETSAATELDKASIIGAPKRKRELSSYENPDLTGTSLFVLRHREGVLGAADSRSIFSTFGNVNSDNGVKFFRIWHNVYGVKAGLAQANLEALYQASEDCYSLKPSPTSTKRVALLVANAREDLGGKNSKMIVFGRLYTETRSKIFIVSPVLVEEAIPKRNKTEDDSLMYPYDVQEVESVGFAGSGSKCLRNVFKARKYDPTVRDENTALDIIRDAMNSARESDYATDGQIKVVAVADRPPSARVGRPYEGGVTLHESNPITPKDPASGYGNWMPGTFDPPVFLYEK